MGGGSGEIKFFRTEVRDPLKNEKTFEGPLLPSVVGIFQDPLSLYTILNNITVSDNCILVWLFAINRTAIPWICFCSKPVCVLVCNLLWIQG